MHQQLAKLLACPVCSDSLTYKGTISDKRYINGHFKCPSGHVFQVKEQMGLLKDAKQSEKEFEWKVNVADEQKYLEVKQEYESYLRNDQKAANHQIIQKLADNVNRSSLTTDSIVLDIASGMGTFLLPLIDKMPAHSTAIGTDIDEKPLRGLMNRAVKAATYEKLTLIATDAKRLSFKKATFSTVSSFFGFDNIHETLQALRECTRILRPNGQTFFASL